MVDSETTLLDCAHSIIASVPRLARLMRQDLRLHSAGLFTEPQFRVMAHLYREGSKCFSRLADHMGVSRPSMSKLVYGLETRGLVRRERDPSDRRRVLLALSSKGIEAYEALLGRTERHIVNWIQELDSEQCAEIVRSFHLLVEAFEQVELPESYDHEPFSEMYDEIDDATNERVSDEMASYGEVEDEMLLEAPDEMATYDEVEDETTDEEVSGETVKDAAMEAAE